jgi:DNA-binding Lrp family transcriptional regulator
VKTNKSHDINECFYLYYKHNQGRTIKVLAEEVSLSESTVSRRIKHAKQIL